MARTLRLAWPCAVVCSLVAMASAQDEAPPEPQKLQVVLVDQDLTLNGKAVPFPATRADLIKLLGKPTRVTEGLFTSVTWDELGLYATEDPKTLKIAAFTIALDKGPYEYWPKKSYQGTLRVDGVEVTAQSTGAEINRTKKGKPFKRIDLLQSWMIDHPDVSVHLLDADPKLKSEKANVSFLQIGAKPRK